MDEPLDDGELAAEVVINLVKHFEGCKLKAYLCPAGKLTVGYGHLVLPEDGIELGQTIELWEAEAFLYDDIQIATRGVMRQVDVELHPFQLAALVDFVFNLGSGQFGTSTLLKKVNSGDHAGAALEFKRWIFAGGKPLQGLARRRDAEAGLWISGHAMTTRWSEVLIS